MANRRSEHAQAVGEWVALRRAEVGLSQKELAARIEGVAGDRTVSNVETGATAVALRNRPAWEAALGWPAGSLTRAYRTGEQPTPAAETGDGADLLMRAGVPAEYHAHPDVLGILRTRDLSDRQRIELLEVWVTHHKTFRQTVELARRAAQ